jgi:hypothetical protein
MIITDQIVLLTMRQPKVIMVATSVAILTMMQPKTVPIRTMWQPKTSLEVIVALARYRR